VDIPQLELRRFVDNPRLVVARHKLAVVEARGVRVVVALCAGVARALRQRDSLLERQHIGGEPIGVERDGVRVAFQQRRGRLAEVEGVSNRVQGDAEAVAGALRLPVVPEPLAQRLAREAVRWMRH
jgi:hypothetical protein